MPFLIKHHILKEIGVFVLKKVFDFVKSSKKKFQVKIDSKFKGNLVYGEILIRGKSKRDFNLYIYMPSINGK